MRVRQSAFDAFLAAGEAVGEADVDQEELRGELAASLERARAEVSGGDEAELASSLRALAASATRLAHAVERGAFARGS